MLAAVSLLSVALVRCCLRRQPGRLARPRRVLGPALLACLPALILAACSSGSPAPSTPVQPARDYLNNTVDWIEEHALAREGTDWPQIRREVQAVAPDPHTTAETYAAIRLVVNSLKDVSAFFLEPEAMADYTGLGVNALYPQGTVVFVEPHSPAASAGVREGDVVETINGQPLKPQGGGPPAGYAGTWFVDTSGGSVFRLGIRRAQQSQPLDLEVPRTAARYDGVPLARRFESGVDGVGAIGYIELPWDGGWDDYATRTQRAIRAIDQPEACGWIVDVRRNIGGDFWTYLAGIGPILGEGDLGGFIFPSGAREGWSYRAGQVFWGARQRDESYVADPIYARKHAAAGSRAHQSRHLCRRRAGQSRAAGSTRYAELRRADRRPAGPPAAHVSE